MMDPNLVSMTGGRQAAAAKARQQQEEEEITGYAWEELAEKWEFKIIRSGTSTFRHRGKLQEVLEEEAKAGWELVEKFDDNRVRLRRPASAKRDDHGLDFDPYRTWIGVSETGMVVRGLVVGGLLLVALILVFVLGIVANT